MTDDADTEGPRSSKAALWAGRAIYWIVAAACIATILWHMDRYVRMPKGRTWNVLSRTIKREAKPKDAIAFRPSWLSGYAMDRKRYRGVFKPKDVVDSRRPGAAHDRVWVVHGFFTASERRPPVGYTELNFRRVGKVHLQLIERKR